MATKRLSKREKELIAEETVGEVVQGLVEKSRVAPRRSFAAKGNFLVNDTFTEIVSELSNKELSTIDPPRELVFKQYRTARRAVINELKAQLAFYRQLTPSDFRKGVRYVRKQQQQTRKKAKVL